MFWKCVNKQHTSFARFRIWTLTYISWTQAKGAVVSLLVKNLINKGSVNQATLLLQKQCFSSFGKLFLCDFRTWKVFCALKNEQRHFFTWFQIFELDFLFDWPQICSILSKTWFWALNCEQKILTKHENCFLTKM